MHAALSTLAVVLLGRSALYAANCSVLCHAHNMSRTLIKLDGQAMDLEALASVSGLDWGVVKEEGSYYLTSPLFDSVPDVADAYTLAQQVLPLLNGAAGINIPNFEPVKLSGSAKRQNESGTSTQAAQSISAGARIRREISPASLEQSPDIDSWMVRARMDTYARRAMELYGSLEHSWRNLYIILEVMEESCGGDKHLLAASWLPDEAEIRLFKYTANNWQALGSEARHGKEQWKPPAKPMSLQDARELIRLTLLAWLQRPLP